MQKWAVWAGNCFMTPKYVSSLYLELSAWSAWPKFMHTNGSPSAWKRAKTGKSIHTFRIFVDNMGAAKKHSCTSSTKGLKFLQNFPPRTRKLITVLGDFMVPFLPRTHFKKERKKLLFLRTIREIFIMYPNVFITRVISWGTMDIGWIVKYFEP